MSNREPDGQSTEIDHAKLGEVHVKRILARPHSGWTPHQEDLARGWLEELKATKDAETAKVASDSLKVANDSLKVANQSLRVMWLTLLAALAAILATYLTWKSTN